MTSEGAPARASVPPSVWLTVEALDLTARPPAVLREGPVDPAALLAALEA